MNTQTLKSLIHVELERARSASWKGTDVAIIFFYNEVMRLIDLFEKDKELGKQLITEFKQDLKAVPDKIDKTQFH